MSGGGSALSADVLICGAGVVGLSIALRLLRAGYENILIIEKEDRVGRHASGRNSGVLHAGIYYSSDSLKARFCQAGNRLMKEYCRSNGLPLLEAGKVVVARDESELKTLRMLHERAVANGAAVELIEEERLGEIEPNANTTGLALFSRDTAAVDPAAVISRMLEELGASGRVKVLFCTEFLSLKGSCALTSAGLIRFGLFVNAAGAHSDKVAHSFGVGRRYRLLPFKGIYRKLKRQKAGMVRGNIYPVPDLRNPFLGVHFSRSVGGDVYLGPTAIPAFGRENYAAFEGLGAEALGIAYMDAVLFASNRKFRSVALTEPGKYFFKRFFNDARSLVKELDPDDLEKTPKSGIRPQLVDWETKELVADYVVLKDGDSIHLLNTISPAFTCSLAFAEFIYDEYVKKS